MFINIRFLFGFNSEDSNVRRKKRTDDVESEDDNNVNDNSIETDDNNDRSLSDEDYEEYEDGFENKGYRLIFQF